MHIRSFILASVAAIALTPSAFAVNLCQTRVLDGGTTTVQVPDTVIPGGTKQEPVFGPVTKKVGDGFAGPSRPGPTDYSVATFCPKAAAAGTCTGQTLAEFVATPLFKLVTTTEKVGEITVKLPDTVIQNPPVVIENPDIPQYRVGVLIPATKWTPEKWVGTDWKNGSCPN